MDERYRLKDKENPSAIFARHLLFPHLRYALYCPDPLRDLSKDQDKIAVLQDRYCQTWKNLAEEQLLFNLTKLRTGIYSRIAMGFMALQS
jgi:hypothetical protein